ncbi:MAG: GGDEF domain-containing protein [Gammaproteobacteria bacterium HGW-Gammaproteobacteria-3]|nr:MAG: GGDEF domain-containing protein [Gammaproteobacteria bacterium HGW-Gammaproteobacteria-3]
MVTNSPHLAVVNSNTFEATKTVNLHHYDISSALQTTLEFNQLLNIFSNKIQNLLPHSGFIYSNPAFDLEIQNGIVTRNTCSYALKIEDLSLGELKLMRRQKFSAADMSLLETLLCCLIYPLKNATLYKQAINQAFTDPLTQTQNRTAFNDSVEREIYLARRSNKPLGLIFLDIDHFKAINDQFGHECGDIVLTSVAKWIRESIRNSDVVYRYGGEEFVVLLRETDAEGALLLAERIRRHIENHTLAYGMETLKLTASFGVSSLRDNDDIEHLLVRADQAMYRAKNSGRNRVVAG